MGKKINVQELLDSAVLDNVDTGEETRELKAQRNTELSASVENDGKKESAALKKGKEGTGNRFSGITNATGLSKPNTGERKKIEAFMALMESDNYPDRKEQFIFRLSKACFSDYEKLTSAYNYKMGEKASRNDIMRKVLEHFHSQYIPQLLKTLERI
ncbi:hypothetical protein [Flagellimonas meridianipacifica]|uniref:Uncharacterized protein n=1 Tax=Flagellimonas meridianipacifica TaxID=1080225 RepID=A0A2T0MFA0_9FLAO|nr:hypothetical protein [Allomuricauda pacifica]PRX56248.1 hypothetical protein CLV81_0242 [Allomuricauda pacifica]